MGQKNRNDIALIWVVITFVLAAALRLYQLGSEGLWIDEGASLRDITADHWSTSRCSKPLFYFLLYVWSHVTNSVFGLRLLAALFGIGGVVVLYLMGRDMFSKRVGTAAALMMAISPIHINHSQEIRMYSLLALCSVLSTYMIFLLMKQWTIKRGLAYVLFTWAMLASQPMSVFLVPVHGLYILFFYKEAGSKVVFRGLACLLAAFALWSPAIPAAMGFGDDFVSKETSESRKLLTLVDMPFLYGQFLHGKWNRSSYSDNLPLKYTFYAYSFGVTLMAAGACFLGRRRREIWLATMWAVIPLMLLIALSSFTKCYLLLRYMIYITPALYLLVAVAIVSAPRRLYPVLLAMLFVLPGKHLYKYYSYSRHPQWKEAVSYLKSHVQPTEPIFLYRACTHTVFSYYYYDGKVRGDKGVRWKLVAMRSPQGRLMDMPDHDPKRIIAASVSPHNKSWLVVSQAGPKTSYRVEKELIRQKFKVNRHKVRAISVFRVEQ